MLKATSSKPQPLLLSGGTVLTRNPLMGDWEQADVLLGGSLIVGVGPGLLSAAEDDDMLVIDCTGCVVMPAQPDFAAPAGTGVGTLTCGNPADIVVVRLGESEGTPTGPVINRPSHLDIVLSQGQVQLWDGRPVNLAAATPAEPTEATVKSDQEHAYAGMWIDDTDFLHQELLPDGRYDETRGGRPHAYQGRYWIQGDRIEYLDDLGFWAFGEFRDGVLHHAGYRLNRG
ncbi:Atu4866 domain-containing protein [Kineosporia sp. NBRC 101677]|uniref:Atu4866 domain-containing protein n=1 Tax=Kineosporia sp. NBRC 101677 TaxID=3032197 RepID=UPI0025535FE4|nr:Atu4866 domain-containing protein [Kineosporia sp. NBRC 101677]